MAKAQQTVIASEFQSTPDPKPGADVTPTALNPAVGSGTAKASGSAGDDRITLFDLEKDSDHVIQTGAGNDVFVFGANSPNVKINGIIKFGDDATPGVGDQVFLNHSVQDYVFTIRSDGGIKIQYIGENNGDGDAVTFYGADQFIFRGIDPVTGANYENHSYTPTELKSILDPASGFDA